MKTRKNLRHLLLAGALLVLLGAGLRVWLVQSERPYRDLRKAVRLLQFEIERYAVDNEGSYPADLETFIEDKGVALPDNPFGTGKLRILKPGDPWKPGGIVYVGWGGGSLFRASGKRYIEDYILAAYSKCNYPQMQVVSSEMIKNYSGHWLNSPKESLNTIAWTHVDILLGSYPEYLEVVAGEPRDPGSTPMNY